jgi:hypothetical protein
LAVWEWELVLVEWELALVEWELALEESALEWGMWASRLVLP